MSVTAKNMHKGFWQLADPKIWVASTVPMVLGVILAVSYYQAFSPYWFFVAILGVYLIEIGKNAINECIDYITGVDPGVDSAHRTDFSGGKKTIVDGLLTVGQSALIGLVTMGAAALVGLYVVFFREFGVIYIGLAGFLLAAVYSIPPFKLCYRGLGEIAVGITFGPLVLNGMFLVMAQRYAVLPLLVSVPIGLLITNVLWINQIPDYETDKAGGKRNWVVRLGKQRATKIYGLIFIFNYLSILVISAFTANPVWLLGLATIPKAIQAVRNCAENYNNIGKLISSNAATVEIYLLTGGLLTAAALLDGLVL